MDSISEALHSVQEVQRSQGERIVAIEIRVNRELASREWVREELEAIKSAAFRTENIITKLSEKMEQIVDNQRSLFGSQSDLMKQRAEREQDEHIAKLEALREEQAAKIKAITDEHTIKVEALKSRTFVVMIKEQWAPVLGFIVVGAAILALIGNTLLSFMASQGYEPAPKPTGITVPYAAATPRPNRR